jgi:hypothetical protein
VIAAATVAATYKAPAESLNNHIRIYVVSIVVTVRLRIMVLDVAGVEIELNNAQT